ncbi:Cu(I)-responsive transcriptional regulator [Pleomorphomonas carboxyditropha]|uniref:Cu(I)-responsive transcriptional regulator n=1 Tax=Pleomorphomonas carboxyditropha TaxID=2023338 RepID=A0A2G9X267_9HYPH|nr:Cu(I)-responsive transcriptional regulator [Pleomorphomonas carboxyditropha]PIP00461.1 Cu(I)-responsive transcriptional regulator [Pleomorphomonas carboxyditropha]
MNIGEAARASGVTAKMIRYYESTGLLRPAARRNNGYRDYGAVDVHELRFIRRARGLGFEMAEITELLSLWRDRDRASRDVHRVASGHIEALRTRIAELQGMVDTLSTLVACCHGDDRPDCPILSDLGGGLGAGQPLDPAKRHRYRAGISG